MSAGNWLSPVEIVDSKVFGLGLSVADGFSGGGDISFFDDEILVRLAKVFRWQPLMQVRIGGRWQLVR